MYCNSFCKFRKISQNLGNSSKTVFPPAQVQAQLANCKVQTQRCLQQHVNSTSKRASIHRTAADFKLALTLLCTNDSKCQHVEWCFTPEMRMKLLSTHTESHQRCTLQSLGSLLPSNKRGALTTLLRYPVAPHKVSAPPNTQYQSVELLGIWRMGDRQAPPELSRTAALLQLVLQLPTAPE